MNQVSRLYDTLFSFESAKHSTSYPIHKRLQLDVRYTDLLDWILDQVQISADDHVLDAGCGTGYSLLKLAKEKGVTGKGISLAKQEIAFARQQTNQLKLNQQIQFEVVSFEEPLTEKYNKVLAIESIKHVPNVEFVISNLIRGLKEDGILIIADDFILEEGSRTLDKHKKLWQVLGFDLRDRTVNRLEEQGLRVDQYELTTTVPRRSKELLSILIFLIGLVLLLIPARQRLKLEIYLGGLLLEQLYNHRQVGYFVLIAHKKKPS